MAAGQDGRALTLHMAKRSNFQPPGWHTVTPRIIVPGAEKLVEFIKKVFGAAGDYRPQAPAELKLGDSVIMISDAGIRDAMTACLYVYVENADITWQRAIEAVASGGWRRPVSYHSPR